MKGSSFAIVRVVGKARGHLTRPTSSPGSRRCAGYLVSRTSVSIRCPRRVTSEAFVPSVVRPCHICKWTAPCLSHQPGASIRMCLFLLRDTSSWIAGQTGMSTGRPSQNLVLFQPRVVCRAVMWRVQPAAHAGRWAACRTTLRQCVVRSALRCCDPLLVDALSEGHFEAVTAVSSEPDKGWPLLTVAPDKILMVNVP